MDVRIGAEGVAEAVRRLGAVLSRDRVKEMNSFAAEAVMEGVREHLDQMSPSRHRTADRLGATHTKHLEYASGRVSADGADAAGFRVLIRETPALVRAFGEVTVRPKRGKWLTIPIHRDAYGKRVRDLKAEGRVLFRPGKARILAESAEGGKGLRPMYALCREVRLPKDAGLLPTAGELAQRAAEAAEDFLLVEG